MSYRGADSKLPEVVQPRSKHAPILWRKQNVKIARCIADIFLHGDGNVLMYKKLRRGSRKGMYGWGRGCGRRRRRGRRAGRRGALRRRGTPWGSTVIPTPPAPVARSPRFPTAPPPAVAPARRKSRPPPCPTRPIAASATASASPATSPFVLVLELSEWLRRSRRRRVHVGGETIYVELTRVLPGARL
jgi:hypothetical protein